MVAAVRSFFPATAGNRSLIKSFTAQSAVASAEACNRLADPASPVSIHPRGTSIGDHRSQTFRANPTTGGCLF
jgi:hypothetical protein